MNDLISRENAKDYFCEHCDERVIFGLDVDVCREKLGCAIMKMLGNVKTVDAEPVRHGHWIEEPLACNGDSLVRCSCCNRVMRVGKQIGTINNFCPNCWAKMDGDG